MNKFFLVILAAFVLAGCEKKAVGISVSNNSEIPVDFLFESEGCRIYRFYDSGRNHYYANCLNQTTIMEGHTETCGNNCTRTNDYSVVTNYGDWPSNVPVENPERYR